MNSSYRKENGVVRETGTGIVRETGTGIVRETGTGIVRETGTGIAKSKWLAFATMAFLIPLVANADGFAPMDNGYMVATANSDADGQMMIRMGVNQARLSWFATLENGSQVILSGFGQQQDNFLRFELFGLCNTVKAVESGSGGKAVESGSGNKAVESGSGNKAVESGSGNKAVESGSGSKAVESGSGNKAASCFAGDKAVESGSGNKAVESGSGNKAVESGSGNKAVESGSGNKRATFMGTFEGIFECGTLSGFYTGPDGGNSMFVEFAAPGPRSLRCGTPVEIQ